MSETLLDISFNSLDEIYNQNSNLYEIRDDFSNTLEYYMFDYPPSDGRSEFLIYIQEAVQYSNNEVNILNETKNNLETKEIKSPYNLYDMSNKNTNYTVFLDNKIDIIINGIKERINKHKLLNPGNNFDINLLDDNYENLFKYNLNMNTLKNIAKKKNIKFSNVNKTLLLKNIFFSLYYSFFIKKIQKVFRRYLYKSFILLKGPAFKNKSLSLNTTDFITLENVTEIHPDEFFSIECDSEIYSFNINSIFSYIFKNNKSINPYNRKLFPPYIIKYIEKYISLSKCLNKQVNTIENLDIKKFNKYKQLEFRSLSLFQKINELDNHSDPFWFLNLSFKRTKQLIEIFMDIWDYRAELTYELKCEIYPPDGNLFKHFNLSQLIKKNDIIYLKNNILTIFENLLNANSTISNKKLAAIYILSSLTLVSEDAANSMPYYYHGVVNI